MIYDEKTISEIYSEMTTLEEYKESIDKNEIIYVFQFLSSNKGTVFIRQVEDGTIVVDNKQKQYVASQSLIDLLERLSHSKTRDYIILNED